LPDEVSKIAGGGGNAPQPVTQRGDLWICGAHRVLCGDATNRADVERLLDGERANLVLTDPPYGTNKRTQKKNGEIGGGGYGKGLRDGGWKFKRSARPYAPILGDNSTDAARLNWEIVKDVSDNQIIWGGNFFADFLPASRCWLVWDKQNGATDFADAELAWTSFDKPVRLYRFLWNGVCHRGSHVLNPVPRVHPTQKPVELHMEILNVYGEAGDIVLDCFGGSGTTLIAAEQSWMKCRMMELSKAYVDIIVGRWEKLTGGKAELVRD